MLSAKPVLVVLAMFTTAVLVQLVSAIPDLVVGRDVGGYRGQFSGRAWRIEDTLGLRLWRGLGVHHEGSLRLGTPKRKVLQMG